VNVRERDFHIAAPAHVAAGVVTFRSHNAGPDTHELLVVRSTSDHLPLRADGLTVDEDAIKHLTAGTIEGVAPGHDGESRIRLAPGHYELLCNMAGHYRGGMQADLVVS
jgi:uncharacterized cupredoxin-like copper-binding protein